MAQKPDCIFCKITNGEAPAYIVWEDDAYMAFLSIFPNTEGVTVVIPKDHHDSYFADLPEQVRAGLIEAATSVAKLLDQKFTDVGRTALVFEGFGVNHVHAKLYPLHGTVGEWEVRDKPVETFFDTYPGYLSTHDTKQMSPEDLKDTLKKLTD